MNRWPAVLLVLLFSAETNAQSLFHQFNKLSRPEKWWTVTHLFVAGKAWHATVHVRGVVEQQLASGTPDTIRNGGKIDAFRHAYWMACVSRSIGERKARKLGKAHEKGNYLAFKKGLNDEGALPDSLSGIMDLYNNDAGLAIARLNPAADDRYLQSAILTAIGRGQLKMLRHLPDGTLTDCAGNIVVNSHSWSRPYCLISTRGVH